MPEVEERVDRLERILGEFITGVGREFNKLYNSQMRTEAELREFKDEVKVFKDEVTEYKDEAEKDRKTMNKQWAELAQKMGTVVEDLVAPSIPRVAKDALGLELEFFGTRMKKKLKDGRSKEYDVIATAGEYALLNSTKSTFESTDVKDFFREIREFRDFFPEYKEKEIIGIIASLYLDESVITYAERSGLFTLAVGEELMDVKNSKGFKPKEW